MLQGPPIPDLLGKGGPFVLHICCNFTSYSPAPELYQAARAQLFNLKGHNSTTKYQYLHGAKAAKGRFSTSSTIVRGVVPVWAAAQQA